MKILFLINWKITYCDSVPDDIQPSDYCCPQELFWFFKYFKSNPLVDVVDISAPKWIARIENKVRFHFYQTLRILPRIKKYDLVFIHGSDSSMLICALKRIFNLNIPPILDVDISSFHRASTSGVIHRLSQFASKGFDYMVYHTSTQSEYYKEQFPWLVDKSEFVSLGVDSRYWKNKLYQAREDKGTYIVCVGYRKRDWKTLLSAFEKADIREKLYLIGNPALECQNQNVKVLPFIPIEELMTYIVNAKFSVVPLDDFNYSFGQITLLQQMALGVSIVAADVPAIRDYIKNTGVVSYQPYNVEDLAQKLKYMSERKSEEIFQMKKTNIATVNTAFSEQLMAARFEEICLHLVESKRE